MVRKEIEQLDATIVFTSHIMAEVEQLCDRIAFLNKGVIYKIDTPFNLKKLINEHSLIVAFLKFPANAEKILQHLPVQERKQEKIVFHLKFATRASQLFRTCSPALRLQPHNQYFY